MNAFVSSSGGKETVLSSYKAMRDMGVRITHILNMISEDGTKSCSHGIRSGLLRSQAEAMGIPIIQKSTTPKTYEAEFKKAVAELKKEGVVAGVFGDIDFQPHRDWVERVCDEAGVKAILPLWGREREEILEEFIGAGNKTVVVAVKSDMLGPEWLGRNLDRDFVRDLKGLDKVDLCGEAGEYHTFVISGPIFKKSIKLLKTKKIRTNTHCFLDILDYEIA